MRVCVVLAMVLAVPAAFSQWTMQKSGVTASLRGIENVGGGVAWASGSGGTVLRTLNGGKVWQKCAVPPGGEKLDFRGVQAFDAKTAVVMSSGPGDDSRLYQTTDGCASWVQVAVNDKREGFWDGMILARNYRHPERGTIYLLGDPIDHKFEVLKLAAPTAAGAKLKKFKRGGGPKADDGESSFAASNSALQLGPNGLGFATGGGKQSHWYDVQDNAVDSTPWWYTSMIPVGNGKEASGTFSVAFRLPDPRRLRWLDVGKNLIGKGTSHWIGVAVGGDYKDPNDGSMSAAYTCDDAHRWSPPPTDAMPHGYRSAVAYDAKLKAWITVGPNGTDVSTDDGKNWQALRPAAGDAADADKGWNALSLPFVVGSKGRIGVLRDGAVVTK